MTATPHKEFDPAAAASKALEGFSYSRLTTPQAGLSAARGVETEIWRCQRSDSGVAAFDIAVTARGISVMGDFEGLIFQAGRGLTFLAGDDVSGYIHSKLDPHCRESTFGRDGFLAGCADLALNKLDAVVDEATRHGFSPDFVVCDATLEAIRGIGTYSGRKTPGMAGCGANGVTQLLVTVLPSILHVADRCKRLPAGCLSSLESIEEFLLAAETLGIDRKSTADDATRFLKERAGGGIVGAEWPDRFQMELPSARLLFLLHLVNQAAKVIVKIKSQWESMDTSRPCFRRSLEATYVRGRPMSTFSVYS